MRRKMTFFQFWEQPEELIMSSNQQKFVPSHPTKFRSNSGLSGLQNARVGLVLPPLGTEVFRHFTTVSLEEIQQQRGVKINKDNNMEVTQKHQHAAGDLESGKPLPSIYGDPPPEFVNTPLEDLDPFYQSQKTFLVLSKGKTIYRFNADPACYLLSPFNLVRTTAIKILLHSFFRLFILLTVVSNCVLMTTVKPPAWSKSVVYGILAVYAFEMLIKVVARGLCLGRFTFLRNPWNWLDVMVIATVYLTVMVDLGTLSVFQVLPALKIIPLIPGLKATVGVLVESLKKLTSITILTIFFLSSFAVIALQLFMGKLRQKCVLTPTLSFQNLSARDNFTSDFDFHEYINNQDNHYYPSESNDALLCGNTSDAGLCPEGYVCLKTGRNPNYGYTSYDSFGWAFLALFRLMTLDFWENLLELTLRADGKIYAVFFVVVIVLVSYHLVALIVAVMAMAYAEQRQDEMAEAKQKSKEYHAMIDRREASGSAYPSEKHHQKIRRSEEASADEKSQKPEQTAQEEPSPHSPGCHTFTNIFLKWNCCGCWQWCKMGLHRFVMDPFFDFAITVCVILNTVFMAMEHYPMMHRFESVLSQAYLVFTAIFTAEVVIKLLAMGPYFFFQEGWNIFDSIIVTFNLLELVLKLSMERLYQVMRVFKLAKFWSTFNILMKTTGKSVLALRHLILLLAFVVFTFSVVGMHLFGNNYKAYVCRITVDCTLPRWHMSDFFHAFLLVFRVLCGEWIETMWDCMEVAGQTQCLIFYMIFLVIAKLLVLNLFLAFLIRSSNKDQEERENSLHIAMNRITRALIWTKSRLLGHLWMGKKKHTSLNPPEFNNDNVARKELLALTFVRPEEPQSQHEEWSQQKQAEVQVDDDDGNTPSKCLESSVSDIKTFQGGRRICLNFRRACACLVEKKYFEGFITFMILLSCGALVFEDIYLEKRLLIKTILEYVEQVFTCVFVAELLLKWFAGGFKKFFTNPWCCLDFLVVCTFPVLLTANSLGFSPTGAIKSLRPLRVLCRFEGMKVALKTLFGAIPSCFHVLLACLTFWLIFAIVGVELFGGKFYYCLNDTNNEMFHSSQVKNKSECLMLVEENFTEVRWTNVKVTFDNVGMAYLALLQVATMKGWLALMYAAVDATKIESQPEYEINVYIYLYFVFFIIVGSFLTLNFLVGAIIEHLKQQKAKSGGVGLFLTQEQTKYYNLMKAGTHKRPERRIPRPKNKLQAQIFDLVTTSSFEIFVMVVICFQVVTLMVETDDQSVEKDFVLYWIYFACVVFFTAECVLKLVALSQHYFLSGWNVFDFVILILSVVGLFLERYFVSPGLFRVVRLIRIGRIPHLIRGARGLRRLLLASMLSLPALLNMVLLHILIMFIFAIFGMNNFAYVRKGGMMNEMFNFETFGNSMSCLLTITTSAGWDGLLIPVMRTPPDCDPLRENPGTPIMGDCGSPVAGMIFFSSYIVLSFLVMANMCIVIIMENFNIAAEQSTDEVCKMDFEMFYETWERFDPDASGYIHYNQLSDFCDALQDPLRIPKPNRIKLVSMDLPLLSGDRIHCADVLQALAAQVLEDPGEMDNLKAKMEESLMVHIPSRPGSHERVSSTLRRKLEDVAAGIIQRAYRKHLTQSEVQMAATPRGLPSASQ